MPSSAEPALAPRDIMGAGLCIGCGGCAAKRGGEMAFDGYGQMKPVGSWAAERDAEFARICPFTPVTRTEDEIAAGRFPAATHADPRIGRYEEAFVGHVAQGDFRMGGSSGGMVSWVAAELLRRGLVDGVAHVIPADPDSDGRFFRYRISRSIDAVHQGARSRYYPIELSEVLREIAAVPGRYAVVGVPCFIKAIHLQRAADPVLAERIAFTLGLFCGHMKSARLVESFAWQLDAPFEQVRAVEYRRKDPDRPANWYTAHLDLADGSARWKDWWHLADGDWGAGFFQNSACNFCDDVVAETADIAFGDAWVEPYSSDGRGTNVAIVRSPQIHAIVREAIGEGRLALDSVDQEFIVNTQAAGFRQRREGLAYRLRVMPPRVVPRKRVAPGGRDLPWRRKAIYRMRAGISAWSHRVFAAARRLRWPALYTRWGWAVLHLYQAFAYLRGPIGRLIARIDRQPDA